MDKIVIVGGGGHCKSCIDVIERQGIYFIEGIIDKNEILGTKILGYPVIGRDEDIPEICKEVKNFHIAVGQIKSPEVRIRIYQTIKNAGGILPVIISPMAYVSKHAIVGEGTIIMHQAIINADVKIGVNCIINTKALIEHEVYVGNHCHISTNAVVNGQTQIGDNSFVGSGAIVIQCVILEPNSFIKANSLVK